MTPSWEFLSILQTPRHSAAELKSQPMMDVHMPLMDGLEASLAIRRRERETAGRLPIIALTARAMREDERACLDAGMDAYMAKPIHAPELLALVARVVKGG